MTEVCAVNYVDHVGIAVNDIQAALDFFARPTSGLLTPKWSKWTTRACEPA